MKAEKLAGLQPERIWAHFEKLCAIPHGSFHTDAICGYLEGFAGDLGLRCIRDEANNLIIFKPASAGYEDHEPVILQGHMDMVCQKDEGVCIDMDTQPIDVTYNEEFVYAKGTTLGADDGIGIAMIQALLEDPDAVHPPLEIIITSEEEVGLLGANAIDLSSLKGRRMLNLDTHNEKVLNAGCAGGTRVVLEMPVDWESSDLPRISIAIEGLKGGHSGSVIGNPHANADKALAALLKQLREKLPLQLEQLSGGVAGNAIPGSARAVIACPEGMGEAINAHCNAYAQYLRENFEEPTASIMVSLHAEQAKVLTLEATDRVLALLEALPNGVQAWHPDFEGLPLTSLNLGILRLEEDKLFLQTNLRSGVNEKRDALQAQLKTLAEAHGCSYQESGIYSAWEYRKDSPLRDTIVSLYRKRFGTEPVVRVIHAGLECGVLSQKLPGLDCISMGPTAYDIHTTRERADIASTETGWYFLKEILAAL